MKVKAKKDLRFGKRKEFLLPKGRIAEIGSSDGTVAVLSLPEMEGIYCGRFSLKNFIEVKPWKVGWKQIGFNVQRLTKL